MGIIRIKLKEGFNIKFIIPDNSNMSPPCLPFIYKREIPVEGWDGPDEVIVDSNMVIWTDFSGHGFGYGRCSLKDFISPLTNPQFIKDVIDLYKEKAVEALSYDILKQVCLRLGCSSPYSIKLAKEFNLPLKTINCSHCDGLGKIASVDV